MDGRSRKKAERANRMNENKQDLGVEGGETH